MRFQRAPVIPDARCYPVTRRLNTGSTLTVI